MEVAMNDEIIIGCPKEVKEFVKRHPSLPTKFDALHATLKKTFIREIALPTDADRAIFFLGRLSAEDFWEIFLLCANGYGIGGLKILRGLYERAVTAAYIAKNPEEAQRFWDYHHVQVGRRFNHAKQVFDMTKHFTAEKIEEIKTSYQSAKEKFQETLCEKCKTTRTQFSWSQLDIASMAAKSRGDLRDLYFPCYFVPTMQSHATVQSLLDRLLEEDGLVRFDEAAQPDRADEALIGAHKVILLVLDTQNGFFKLGLEDELQGRMADFMEVWSKQRELIHN